MASKVNNRGKSGGGEANSQWVVALPLATRFLLADKLRQFLEQVEVFDCIVRKFFILSFMCGFSEF